MNAPHGSGRPTWVYILGGCGGVVALSTIACCVGMAVMTGGAEGGTRYANNMESYANEYIAQHQILEPGESIVAYYDATISLDGTEAAIVTDRRLIYHNAGVNTAIPLNEITTIDNREEGMIGTIIDVHSTTGQHIHVEVAPFNDGPGFLNALQRQRELSGPAPMPAPNPFGY